MTLYLQCGRILGATRDNRMVLCEKKLGHEWKCEPAAEFYLYTPIEKFEDLEQEKRSA